MIKILSDHNIEGQSAMLWEQGVFLFHNQKEPNPYGAIAPPPNSLLIRNPTLKIYEEKI